MRDTPGEFEQMVLLAILHLGVCWRRGWVSAPVSVAAKLDGT